MNTQGKIVAISISKKKGIQKTNVDKIKLIENYGLEGDVHAGDWHRQVSILAVESIDKMKMKGLPQLNPGDFAENITTEFLDIPHIKIGSRLQFGSSAILEITQIGKECHHHCAIYKAVGDCVMPREGIFARVISGGEIRVDDDVKLIGEYDNAELSRSI